jgi:hypothetical protein
LPAACRRPCAAFILCIHHNFLYCCISAATSRHFKNVGTFVSLLHASYLELRRFLRSYEGGKNNEKKNHNSELGRDLMGPSNFTHATIFLCSFQWCRSRRYSGDTICTTRSTDILWYSNNILCGNKMLNIIVFISSFLSLYHKVLRSYVFLQPLTILVNPVTFYSVQMNPLQCSIFE